MKLFNKILFGFISSLVLVTSINASANIRSKSTLFDFEMSPGAAVANERVTVFIHPNTTFVTPGETRIVLKARYDLIDSALLHPVPNMWIFTDPVAMAGAHTLSVDYYLEDVEDADLLRNQIANLDLEISQLETDLLLEEDGAQRAIIQANINLKEVERTTALSELELTRTLIGNEEYSFNASN